MFYKDTSDALLATIAVVGTPLNVWMLAAILSCGYLRGRLRHQWICGILLCNLLELCAMIPIIIVGEINCVPLTFLMFSERFDDFVSNWTLVCLLALLFIKPRDVPVPPVVRRALRVTLLLLPAVAAVVVFSSIHVTLSYDYYHYERYNSTEIWAPNGTLTRSREVFFCKIFDKRSSQAFAVVNCIAPLGLALCLLVALLINRKRHCQDNIKGIPRVEESRVSNAPAQGSEFNNHGGQGSQVNLVSRSREDETVGPYIAMLVMATICDVPILLVNSEIVHLGNYSATIMFWFAFMILSLVRSPVTPAVLMLMPDLRSRVTSWRPWRRNTEGGVAVTYNRMNNATRVM